MVQDEIEFEAEAELPEGLDVFLRREFLVELVVDDRKSPIEVAVEERRQDVEQ